MTVKEKMEKKDILLTTVLALVTAGLFLIPVSFGQPPAGSVERVRAEVVAVENDGIEQFGIVKTGDQRLTLRILDGRFRGETVEGTNMLLGKMDLDKIFTAGDKALVTLNLDPQKTRILSNQVVDHYRIRVELFLLLLFAGLLIAYAGWTGLKALISFVFTAAAIWKLMIPGFLLGIPPVPLSLLIVTAMTAVIIFLIAGVSRMGAVAFLGAISGVGSTALLSLGFGAAFRVHGAVKPFSETLLYSGYPHLNLTSIFLAGIFMASSGAVMDIAMDIAASMREVKEKHPGIGRKELILSGMRVGRAVVGTMTTTLLLAYSGGYTFVLMVFMAQGTPLVNVFNLNYVSSEILHTLVGSFGLVLVAPLTALFGGVLYTDSPAPVVREDILSQS